ncbi:MAG: hypothetical protein ACRDJE_04525 [Dehalococcoidia bacterium]
MNEQAAETLWAKWQQFADGLTTEEAAELNRIQTGDVSGMGSTSLWAKAEAAVAQLTAAERARLEGLLRDAGTARGDESDTTGHMVNLYESNASDPNAGRPRPDGMVPTGGGSLVPGFTLGNTVTGFARLPSVISVPSPFVPRLN